MNRAVVNGLAVGLFVVFAGLALRNVVRDGRWPARVPADAPAYAPQDLMRAMRSVNSAGQVNLEILRSEQQALDAFITSMAAHAPSLEPNVFAEPDQRLAYALNAYHALTLRQLLENAADPTAELRAPIGGQYLSRSALRERFIDPVEDPRVTLALFDGTRGAGVLDGAPFDAAMIDQQLTEAVQRFMRRPSSIRLQGTTVFLSAVVVNAREQFFRRMPVDRRNLLQVVWAFLPESCEGLYPGCLTRAELDRACGRRFETCTVVSVPGDPQPAIQGAH